ncbi:MAG: DUF2306 domain-containing protein [Pseudomonadota bacterium]
MDAATGEISGPAVPSPPPSAPAETRPPRSVWLKRSISSWYGIAALGQLAFIGFILIYYGGRTLSGDWAAWDEKPLIEGYVADDTSGNLMFIGHVLLAAVMTLSGLLQLIPALRRSLPAAHRISGRVFAVSACVLAISGLWLTWVRGTQLSLVSGVAISLDALLILIFVALAWRCALQKRFAEHRRWALRSFMVANGVWFLRVGIMAWVLLNQGPRGMNETLSGPADIVLVFGSYLIPLAILELYFLAQSAGSRRLTVFTSGTVAVGCVITLVGVFGTVAFMWGPYL